jgi:GT2 family glycosyltransferase
MSEVHVLSVAYGAPDGLERALAALADGAFDVTVIDNSSSGEVAALAARHRASYIDAGSNRGFAAAVNLGLRSLPDDGADVLLLNPDALIDTQGVLTLHDFLHRRPRTGAAAPRLVSAAGAGERVLWPFPSPLRIWLEALGLARLPARAGFVIGAVLLLRRSALAEVGGFDERFFLYGEETDWQRRARAHGWSSALCEAVLARHEGAGTSTDEGRRQLLFHAAQETYIRKWFGPLGWWVYRLGAYTGAGLRALALRGERRRAARERMRIYRCGPRRLAAGAGS